MDNINKECLEYFREEIRQYKIMLKGNLRLDYREYVNKKVKYFEYVTDLLEKEELR